MKTARRCLALTSVFSSLASLVIPAFAEDITLTTYYPSPRGVYKELRTTDNAYLAMLAGSLGVGTSTPADKLEVDDNWRDNSSTDWGGGIRIKGNAPSISFWDTDNPAQNFMIHTNADTLNFYVRPSAAGSAWNRMGYFTASGDLVLNNNVGIGTTGPNAALTVDAQGPDTTWNTAAFHKAAIGPNWSHIHWGPTGDWYIRSANSTGNVILQDTGGNVGIGAAPAKKLDVQGGSIRTSGRVGTQNYDPDGGYPGGWGGGIHTWDVYAEGTVAAGSGGAVGSWMNNAGNAGFAANVWANDFSIGNFPGGARWASSLQPNIAWSSYVVYFDRTWSSPPAWGSVGVFPAKGQLYRSEDWSGKRGAAGTTRLGAWCMAGDAPISVYCDCFWNWAFGSGLGCDMYLNRLDLGSTFCNMRVIGTSAGAGDWVSSTTGAVCLRQ